MKNKIQSIKKHFITLLKLALCGAFFALAVVSMTYHGGIVNSTAEAQTTNFGGGTGINAPVISNYFTISGSGQFLLNTNATNTEGATTNWGPFLDVINGGGQTSNQYYTSNVFSTNLNKGLLAPYYVTVPNARYTAFGFTAALGNPTNSSATVLSTNTVTMYIDAGTGQGDWAPFINIGLTLSQAQTNSVNTNVDTGGFTAFRVHAIGMGTNNSTDKGLTNPCYILEAGFSSKPGI